MPTFPSFPRRKPSFYVYWIKTESGYVGPYGKKKWAEEVCHKGHKVVRRKRGINPNKRRKK